MPLDLEETAQIVGAAAWEVERLTRENARLRQDNERLRAQLEQRPPSPSPPEHKERTR